LDWGIDVPVAGAEGKKLYVWFDAPIGYISSTKEWAQNVGKDWEPYWKDADTKLVHFIGKDNIVFHCIIFPAMLKAEGSYILPDNVPANEFLNLEGNKLSTSKNWAVWLHEYLIAPESKDSEFTWKEYQARVNNELADVLGNFVNRALVLTQKYYEGKVPALGNVTPEDQQVLDALQEFPAKIASFIYAYKIREAQSEVMNLARLGNKYLADNEPWKLVKTDAARVETIMHIALQITAKLSLLLEPFLPTTASKLRAFLNLDLTPWEAISNQTILEAGHITNTPEILFQKIEDTFVEQEVEALHSTKEVPVTNFPPQKPNVSFDDFTKMDIRLGKIIEAEKVPKADKLLKLTVDTGIDTRTIVSGIASYYNPEEVVGKTVSVLLNLEPRKIRGVESQGMILMAENENGELSFVSPEKEFGAGGEIR